MISKLTFSVIFLMISSGVLAQVANGRYAILSRHSNLALDVDSLSSADGANVMQWAYWGAPNQHYDIAALGNGYYSIRPVHSGKSLDVFEMSSAPGTNVVQWAYWGGQGQQWAIDDLGNGFFRITSALNGLSLDVWEWSTADGGDIRLWTSTGAVNQQWRLQAVGGITGASCVSTGSVSVSQTIVVSSGTYDGGCQTFNATGALGDGSQDEGQDPVFRVENGATLRNVIIGNNGADGIHFYNGGTIDNIRWTNVGEDALTVKSAGDVFVRNIEGYDGSDKFIQVNAPTNLYVENCIVDNMGKFLRQNGGTTFGFNVDVSNCRISDMNEGIFRTDSPNSNAFISNSVLQDAGTICIGNWASCGASGITYE